MRANELIQQLVDEAIHGGNMAVLLQGDAEGNGYEDARGATVAWLERDNGTVYGSLSEAEEYGYERSDLMQVIVIYP